MRNIIVNACVRFFSESSKLLKPRCHKFILSAVTHSCAPTGAPLPRFPGLLQLRRRGTLCCAEAIATRTKTVMNSMDLPVMSISFLLQFTHHGRIECAVVVNVDGHVFSSFGIA